MNSNRGLTIITLVITMIVIILIASITIYSGMDTINSVKIKQARDATNAIYLALSANEDIIPSGLGDGKMLSEHLNLTDRVLDNKDYELLGLDYTTENCTVVFDKFLSGENTIVYNFSYTDDLNKTYNDLTYTSYMELTKINTKPEFDNTKKINRPVLSETGMVPVDYNDNEVQNVYIENWYNYESTASKLAIIKYNGKKFAWIPRFAYKIQSFYVGKSYDNIPSTAIDIIFLRDGTDYMANGEVLPSGYTVHPAFEGGSTGFWIMTDIEGRENSISNAVDASDNILDANGNKISHLMKNSEYAATIFLLRCLNNNEVHFGEKEFVAAVCGYTIENFDEYSLDYLSTKYIMSAKGQALLDTPWELEIEPVLPDNSNVYLLRDVDNGGRFYYEATAGTVDAAYRYVISK